ncbi:MAG: DNA replication/repair protein RecF [Anaerolineae bacterium]|nr:DNA replication/repair protein RecF [Anaerolineae bacterium]
MHIQSLSLRQFRIYDRLELDLLPASILILGANAQGKTSLLEAMAFLALGTSPLTPVDQHVIHWNAAEADMPFAHIKATVVRKERTETLEIALERKRITNGTYRMQKRIRIDQKTVTRSELAGHLNVVLFLPGDLALVYGSPSERRRYLDNLLSQVYPTYVDVHNAYRQAVSRRNALLRHLRERGGDPLQLKPLEERIVRSGVTVSLYRRQVIQELNLKIDALHRELTGGQAWLQLRYEPNFDLVAPRGPTPGAGMVLEMPASEEPLDIDSLYEGYRQALARRRRHEVERGMTLVGPHRDEIRFVSNGRDMGTFGSRGQQRTAVLALHLAELRWLEAVTGESPVLLLDEVLAELDQVRRGYLLGLLDGVEQTILATTDAELFPEGFRARVPTFTVSAGTITASEAGPSGSDLPGR